MIKNKICFTCKKEKPISDFNKQSRSKEGLTPSCRICIKSRITYKPMSEYKIHVDEGLLAFERWAPVVMKGLIFNYLISDCGRVKSLHKNKILKYSFDADGYPQVMIYGHQKRISRRVHVLVGITFVENDDPIHKTELNHEDGNRSNPYAYNIKWCTPLQNLKHRDETGLGAKFDAYNHPLRKAVIKISTGEIFPSVKLAAINAGIPHLYQYLLKGKGDYKYHE